MDALKFYRFITAVAARTAQLLNYNALAEDADIDLPTAKSWVNILETSGIVFEEKARQNQRRTRKKHKSRKALMQRLSGIVLK